MTFAEHYIDDDLLTRVVIESGAVLPGTLTLTISGGPYNISGLSQQQNAALRARFVGLCENNRNTQYEVRAGVDIIISDTERKHFKPSWYPNGENQIDLDYQQDRVRLAGCNFLAHINLASNYRSQLWIASNADAEFPEIFENLLRVLVAYRLLGLGGVVLHSAGVVIENEAYLFYGRSGAGKSTLAGLAKSSGMAILSDDMNAIIPGPEGYYAEKLPFTGDFSSLPHCPERYRIGGIFKLSKHSNNTLKPISPAYAVNGLMVCCPFVNRDPHHSDQLMTCLQQIVTVNNVEALGFSKIGGFPQLFERS